MKLAIEIDCDGAAVMDNPEAEIARILEDARERFLSAPAYGTVRYTLRDSNGNTVGYVEAGN